MKILANILSEYMTFSQGDSNLFYYNRFYPSILESEKMSQELYTPVMTPPQKIGFFYFYFIIIIKIILNNYLIFNYLIKMRVRHYNLLFIE